MDRKQRIRIGWIESKGAVKERRRIRCLPLAYRAYLPTREGSKEKRIRRRIRRRMEP